MGYDRELLPPDRDQPDTSFSWMRVIVTVVMFALFVAISIYAFSGG
jgi:hypothetical protein